MAVKRVEIVVCDLPHKHDRPAVERVTIDVCSVHAKMFDLGPELITCELCGREFKGEHGLRMHHAKAHKNKRLRAV